ncbi:hypothetical protein L207DRAFT_639742 [Hyaloscypha variabilis F]|uniref:Clr5 domain-containing protein n=1 Tax=Hyaloscypha variabilis (strain UAMH 11265 / GT02V1 / F) TaxID=1149755 RepID=A0A2J6R3D0_HYAVF|nr:hypothetical protein L207DRAFT_639742 [Hyaloscypha variabilis F]
MSYHSTNEAQDEMEKPPPPALIRNPNLKTTYDRALNNEKLESMKEHIHHMYMIEDRSLKEVMDAIAQSHKFIASVHQYERKIKNWGFIKKLSSSDFAFIVATTEKRLTEGKRTIFCYGDHEISPKRIEQYQKWQKRKIRKDGGYPTIKKPPRISFHTPPRFESPEPLSSSHMFEKQNITHPTGLVACSPTRQPQEILTDDYVVGLLLKEANGNEEVTHTYEENMQVTEVSTQDTHAREAACHHGFSPPCPGSPAVSPSPSLSENRSLSDDLPENQGILVKGNVPFTESGYKSAPNLENSPSSLPILEKSPSSFSVDLSAAEGSRCDNDAKTTYSIGTTVNPGYARKYIIELCDDIYSKLRQSVNAANRSALTKTLPELIKALAMKLCHDSPSKTSQMNCETMYFIHKRHKEIARQLEALFNLEGEDEPDRDRGHLEDMSVFDKMNMWIRKAGQENSVHPNTELFEGVQDEAEDPTNERNLSTYYKNILDSPAYEWFLENMAKESILKLETPRPRIRQQILDQLPTGTISKRRTPKFYEIIFELEWQHDMELGLQHELLVESQRQTQPSIVMTGSPWKAQGLSMKHYLAQTWPMTGLQLLDALEQAIINRAKHACVSLPGNTHLESRILSSQLIVTATGPAYFIADCGE